MGGIALFSSEKGRFAKYPYFLVNNFFNTSILYIETSIYTYIIVLIYKEKNIYFNLIRFSCSRAHRIDHFLINIQNLCSLRAGKGREESKIGFSNPFEP